MRRIPLRGLSGSTSRVCNWSADAPPGGELCGGNCRINLAGHPREDVVPSEGVGQVPIPHGGRALDRRDPGRTTADDEQERLRLTPEPAVMKLLQERDETSEGAS